MERIRELAEAPIGAVRRAVDVGRDFHVERLVRPVLVVLPEEGIKPGLLLQEIGRRGLGRLLLQR